MLHLYTSPSCASCRKARAWLVAHQIDFTERNILAQPLTTAELKQILRLTENGTDDIIATRSKAYQALTVDLNQLPLKKVMTLLQQNPTLIKRPMLVDETRLEVGYNAEDIRQFMPRKLRRQELRRAQYLTGFAELAE